MTAAGPDISTWQGGGHFCSGSRPCRGAGWFRLGWNGEESYARDYVEDALKRAVAEARRLANVGEPEYRPHFDPVAEAASGPVFARPIWQALFRVTTDGLTPGSHAGTDDDGALLRATYQEMLGLHEKLWTGRAVAVAAEGVP